MTALAAAPERAFTDEQQAAISARAGSALLAAGAGSGKTAVMVERIATAIRDDDVPVGAILALTFTEKAAGELRERLRARLLELGRDDDARAVDGAWIGTIHGFCARLLRTQPLAAGLDPRFEVLDEPAAARLQAAAFEEALEAWTASDGEPAVEVAAAYGPGLRELVVGAYTTLRAHGHSRPRLRIPPAAPAPDPAALRRAAEDALGALAGANGGARVTAARCALEAALALPDGDQAPWPGALAAAELKGGAQALQGAACERYREEWAAYRSACADRWERVHTAAIDRLLDRFGAACERAKAARSAVDFQDLELRARDLLADAATRARWAARFELIMVDEFQDTNRLQLELLEALERDNLFAVGDEFQSIYRFRHADVEVFRARAAALGEDRLHGLTANFRSREELLDAINAAFAPELGERFAPLRAGAAHPLRAGAPHRRPPGPPADDGVLRLFDPDPPADAPPVELLVTDAGGWEELGDRIGLAAGGDPPARRAEARLVAHRLRREVDAGRRPGDVVVLVRAAASLRLLEQALEEQGLPTYVVGGRGYWSHEQVTDGLAWLSVLANPNDEAALLTVLASPFCGVGSDALVLLARAAREAGCGLWPALRAAVDGVPWLAALPDQERERLVGVVRVLAAERAVAERAPLESLLERAIVATGYDVAVLARPGGDRRLANLRKLMRLAREHERTEGRDVRRFVAAAAGQDVAAAREGEAALESDGLDAVRLMTIHRAKGLEFPVVCVADLGRGAQSTLPRLLVAADGAAGLRLAPLGGGDTVPTAAWRRLADREAAAGAEEERRLLYVATTRARDLLIVSGTVDTAKWPAPRAGGAPIDWVARAFAGDVAAGFGGAPAAGGVAGRVLERDWDGRSARVVCVRNSPGTLPDDALAPRNPAPAAATTALPAVPIQVPATPARPRPAPQRLSYSALASYARCGYRFYLERTLGLPREAPPAPGPHQAGAPAPGLDALARGTLVHRALEALDFASPTPPPADDVRELAAAEGVEIADEEVEDVRALVLAFAQSPLCARLAAARRSRREAPFSFAVEEDGSGPLVTGAVDVLADERDGGVLVVDYKSDRLDGDEPATLVERDYATQRLVYALAALRAGAPRVEVAHCMLERPAEPAARTFTAADAPDLAARLSRLARGLLAHEHPVAAEPHAGLCGDCPGRRALCSWPESMTLRALDAAPTAPARAEPVTARGDAGEQHEDGGDDRDDRRQPERDAEEVHERRDDDGENDPDH